MRRTQGADLPAARAAAAEHPEDVGAQTLVADLDVLGGHVEDGFTRLLDLVRATSGEEREAARQHLLQLFAVVGPHDERVRKARTALMSALF
jgi:putative thioredoxin